MVSPGLVANGGHQPIVLPPDDLKKIIDKTAEFVSKHGPAFEAQLHNEEIQKNKNPKFTFLLPTDPLHSYFRYKVAELKPIPPAGTPMELQSTNQQPVTARVVEEKPQKKTLQYLVSKSRLDVEPKETPPPIFAIDIPSILTAVDLDIMKLAAQFVARNGKSFHAGLITREHKNPQFDFLQPQSPFNPIFNSLVESYTKCMLPPRGIVETLEGEQDKRQILDQILQHAEWEKVQYRSKKTEEDIENELRAERAQIDWHDFVVVETIEFDVEEEEPSEEPTKSQREVDMDTDMDMEMEVEDEAAPTPAPPPAAHPLPEPSKLNIRKTYTRAYDMLSNKALKVQVCPICKQEVAVNEMAEHMRIELLDPRYQAEKRAMLEKIGVSALASGDEITKQLKKFADRRTDIFGNEELEIGRSVIEEEVPQKDPSAIWDGHTASIGRTSTAAHGMSIDDQINAIHQRHNRISDENPSVGPASLPQTSTPASSLPPTTPLAGGVPKMHPSREALLPGPSRPPLIPGFPLSQLPATVGGLPVGIPPGLRPPFASGPGYPPLPTHPHPSVQPEDEPNLKKQKTEAEGASLIPEKQFISENPGPVTVSIALPTVDKEKGGSWNLAGQTLKITMNLTESVGKLKELIKDEIGGMPVNKQNLKIAGQGFLKDQNTLGYYNLRSDSIVNLSVKERGRR